MLQRRGRSSLEIQECPTILKHLYTNEPGNCGPTFLLLHTSPVQQLIMLCSRGSSFSDPLPCVLLLSSWEPVAERDACVISISGAFAALRTPSCASRYSASCTNAFDGQLYPVQNSGVVTLVPSHCPSVTLHTKHRTIGRGRQHDRPSSCVALDQAR
ncbi:hypothetical protein EXIGLDRAFT_303534 [Exidia glandulosa HHB12029]|uniref:Uncharacterized protein n=1 Tax=Exidia glandulosa HHB12029 TaxID=1314781 RepID=A0A165D6F3_EXIGL|nr:hypothetical protein EXIGLDRAFT_303534 [Exidia glandulosa HHB12029]